jgi:hypothetical protein
MKATNATQGDSQVMISLIEQITCVRREIGYRERVYPRWVAANKLKPDKAAYELAAMKAVLSTLLDVHDRQNQELFPPPLEMA